MLKPMARISLTEILTPYLYEMMKSEWQLGVSFTNISVVQEIVSS